MEATHFILDKIQSLLDKFKTAKVRYEYDELAKGHFIEITPQSVYDSLDFCEFEVGIYNDFIKTFPFENICFLSEDALVPLTNVLSEKEGIEYVPYTIEHDKVSIKIEPNPIMHLRYDIVTEQSPDCPEFVFCNSYTGPMMTERLDNLKHAA